MSAPRTAWPRSSATRLAQAIATVVMLALLLALASPSFALKRLEGGGPDQELIDRLEDAKDELPQPPATRPATIRGHVYYNDQRTDGLFADRHDMQTKTGGRQCKAAGKVSDCRAVSKRLTALRADRKAQAALIEDFKGGSVDHLKEQLANLDAQIARDEANLATCNACGPNWLAGKYMVVDVLDSRCNKPEPLAKATVGHDGAFTATFSTDDACKSGGAAAVELRVRLKFCNASYCFSINEKRNDPYAVVHPGASAARPLAVKAGDDITVNTLFFNTGGDDPGVPNNHSVAANYYASIVDAILTLHRTNPIPFYGDRFGEIQYIFPSTDSGTATARSPTEVAISNYDSQPPELKGAFAWIDGKTPAHEYGHILMQRAWDGSYGFDAIGTTAHDYAKAPEPSAQFAFKEAWAEFVARVVFKPTRGCHRRGFDKNGEVAIDCGAIAKRLADLRADRAELAGVIEDFKGGSIDHLKGQLANLDAQIATEDKKLADCRADPTEVDYSNSQTYEGDSLEDTDQNLKGPLGEGAQWRDNVVKALCDWYDDSDDDDRHLAGGGDHFAAEDIYSMWSNLRQMYVDADKYGGQYKKPGLWFCDYVSYYLDVRKSASAVGASVHADYESSIRDLIYNNNIGCSMGAPD